jgi:hypothetical protein
MKSAELSRFSVVVENARLAKNPLVPFQDMPFLNQHAANQGERPCMMMVPISTPPVAIVGG